MRSALDAGGRRDLYDVGLPIYITDEKPLISIIIVINSTSDVPLGFPLFARARLLSGRFAVIKANAIDFIPYSCLYECGPQARRIWTMLDFN